MAVSVADCCHRSKLNCMASVSMLSSMFDEEESQEEIRQSDARRGVKKEMAKPRMSKSARKEEVNQAAVRIVRGKRGKTKL